MGTSVNQLLKIVEGISGKKITRKHENYILDEAEELYARESALTDYVKIEDGVRRVYRSISNSDWNVR